MAVVCAGPKAILDVPATIEYLETRGVPVIAVGQSDVPGFFARSSGIRAAVAADMAEAADRWPRISAWDWGAALSCACPCPRTRHSPDDVARDAVHGRGR